MEIYVKISLISRFPFFMVFKYDLIRCVDFTRITASDDVSIRSHIEYLIQT